MKRRTLMITVLFLTAMLGTATQAQRQSNKMKTEATNYTLSGPYSHKNLTIFLIHGKDQTPGNPPLTLQEALAQKKVVVRETGSVNELTIQNRSSQDVFVQAGDIVKGGQQDRVLALDMILPPKSKRIPIDAFCVEHGRWTQRGQEAASAFNSSNNMLASKGLKLAARNSRSQEEVWENVSMAQGKLAKNYAGAGGIPHGMAFAPSTIAPDPRPADSSFTPPPHPNAVQTNTMPEPVQASRNQNTLRISEGVLRNSGGGRALTDQQAYAAVTSHVSPTSLQLTLENKNVKESSDEYVNRLASIIAGKKDVIGYVFAINGQMNSADVYSSTALFKKLWPKLLNASAVEAFAEWDRAATAEPVTARAAKAFLRDAETGKTEVKTLRPRTKMVKRETEKNLLFEARDRTRGEAWVHRNYLAK